MSTFVPPFPPRPAKPLPLTALFATARRNLIAAFEDAAYAQLLFSARLLNRRLFFCNSPDTIAAAFVSGHDGFERRTPQMRHALAPLLGDALFLSEGEAWRERRGLVAPVVGSSHLGRFAPVVVAAAADAAERWLARPDGSEIDLLPEMSTLTAAILCRMLFGAEAGSEYASDIAAAFAEYEAEIGRTDLAAMLGLPDLLPRWHPRPVRRAAERIHGLFDRAIAEARSGAAADEGAIVADLLGARAATTGPVLDPLAARNEAAGIFLAGHTTTAASLTWAWFLLAQAEVVEARLHAELGSALGGRPPTLDDVPNVPYVRAIVDETLRLYPPVAIFGRQAQRDAVIRERTIPAGSLVFAVPWLLHRHRRLWDQPDHYIPERFLPEDAARLQPCSYIPFGVGPRVCPGQELALTVMVLCIAALAQRVRLRLRTRETIEPVCKVTLRPSAPVLMTVHRRH